MDVARLNLSHGSHADHEKVYRMVREASDTTGRGVGILVDLQGPKIRLGKLKAPVDLATGDRLTITTRDVKGSTKEVPTTYAGLPGDVAAGDMVLIDDGRVRLEVVSVGQDRRAHPGRGARHDQQQQGHQPARRSGLRPGAVGEGQGGPALGTAHDGRPDRAVLRASAPPMPTTSGRSWTRSACTCR